MKIVHLEEEKLTLEQVLDLARKEPILFLISDGEKFLISEADDVEGEFEILRESQAFQKFLEERILVGTAYPTNVLG